MKLLTNLFMGLLAFVLISSAEKVTAVNTNNDENKTYYITLTAYLNDEMASRTDQNSLVIHFGGFQNKVKARVRAKSLIKEIRRDGLFHSTLRRRNTSLKPVTIYYPPEMIKYFEFTVESE